MKIFTNIKENSERLPSKNFLDFGGVPLYMHTLLKFKDYDFYIDTDSQRIIDEVNSNPRLSHCHAYMRNREHIECVNPGIEMTKRFLNEHVEDENEPIFVVHVTCPFLKVETLQRAEVLWKLGADSVCTVDIIRNFCLRKSYHDGHEVKYIPLNFDFRHVPRTQDLEPIYVFNHAMFMFSKKTMFTYDNRVGNRPQFIETKFPENIDIDYQEDLDLARIVLERDK